LETSSSPHKLYGYPSLLKAGLGNMLFPWADCYLWCRDHKAEMIAPYWTKLRIGPYLRRERDKRSYQRFFKSQDHISGFKRLLLLPTVQTINYEQFNGNVFLKNDTIVKFSNMECMDRLVGRHEEIKHALIGMTRPEYLPVPCSETFIAIHVRLGDYAVPDDTAPKWTSRLPIDWYVAALHLIREVLGGNIKTIVFSDGHDSELTPLLVLPNVSRSLYKEAITDILALAQASVIIGSCSTFSTWGVYLSGSASTIWHRGRRPANIFGDDKSSVFEAEWAIDDSLPELFVDRLRQVLV
jgi:hypothetical protein